MSSSRRSLGLALDRVWPLVVLAGLGFYISLVPQSPNDFWWHLRIGERVFTTGAIPTTNMYGWTLPADHPFTYGAWLGEYLMYVLFRWGGASVLHVTRTALALLALGLVGLEAKRVSGSWRLSSLAIALSGLMTVNNLIVRPQLWSWIPFMGFYTLLRRFADGKLRREWLLACPVVMTFWANAHGAFVLGPVLLGIFIVGEAARILLRWSGALAWRDVGWLGFILALCFLTTAVNPQGFGIYGYVFDLMTDPPSQGMVVEWQSPTPEGIANTIFFVSILILFLVIAYARYRPTPTEALLIAGFLWLAWSGQRYVVWFGMVAMPVLLYALAQLLPQRWVRAPALKNALNVVLAAVVWIPVLLAQPWFVESLPLPERYWELVLRDARIAPLQTVETPVGAAAYLREHPGGQLFNEMGYGSYLIWALPEQGVFVDPRVELYPLEIWEDYVRINRSVRYNELLDAYGVDRILLSLRLQPELAAALPQDARWQLEYEDDYAQIWRRN
ncbi:MAG: hypothetical protein JXB35_07810 [Anaerolineae bacterium]|nr:hypothetical protein [Anaerolineae bacterium]